MKNYISEDVNHPEVVIDGLNDEWTKDMWNEFAETDSFSRAAQTKGRDLIASGISPDNIIIRRIDDNASEDSSIKDIWNDEWLKYSCIQELHIYSHGRKGSPEVYCGHNDSIGDIKVFPKLKWSSDAEAYFYGCHTAREPERKYKGKGLKTFAKEQGVVTYGNYYGSRFSEKLDEYVQIDNLIDGSLSENVYLGCYGIPWEDAKSKDYRDSDTNIKKMFELGYDHISMKKFEPAEE